MCIIWKFLLDFLFLDEFYRINIIFSVLLLKFNVRYKRDSYNSRFTLLRIVRIRGNFGCEEKTDKNVF